jgi:uncharacterized protein (DUF1778 family)
MLGLMARSDPQLNFRIPNELRSRLERAASDSGRSLTAELIHRLEQSFEQTAQVIHVAFAESVPREKQEAFARGVVELAASKGMKAKSEMLPAEKVREDMSRAMASYVVSAESGSKPKGPAPRKKGRAR